MLEPISRTKKHLTIDRANVARSVVLGTHDGSRPGTDYRDWRFSTSVETLQGMYFEQWRPGQEGSLKLIKAYLSIYKLKSVRSVGFEREILCLHCDPAEPVDTAHSDYKRGPHIHVVAAEHPLSHAHFALNRTDLASTLESVDTLTGALLSAVQMIKEEVLDEYAKLTPGEYQQE